MIKNIAKSACWFALYFGLQIFGLIAVAVFDLIVGNLVLTDPTNADLVSNEFAAHSLNMAIPALMVAAILYIVIFIVYKKVRKHKFDYQDTKPLNMVYLSFVGIVLNIVVTIGTVIAIMILPTSAADDLNAATSVAIGSQSFVVLLLGTGVLVPIMEEIVFRYGICGTLSRTNKMLGIIISAIIFGWAHGNLIQGTYAAILGLVFGYIYLKHDNLWYSIMLHIAINSSSVLVAQFDLPWLFPMMGLFAIIGIIVMKKCKPELKNFFKRETQNQNTKNIEGDIEI